MFSCLGTTPPIMTTQQLKVIEIQKDVDRSVCFTVPKVHEDFGLKEIGAKVEEQEKDRFNQIFNQIFIPTQFQISLDIS